MTQNSETTSRPTPLASLAVNAEAAAKAFQQFGDALLRLQEQQPELMEALRDAEARRWWRP